MVSHRFHGWRPHWVLSLMLLSAVGPSADGGSLAHFCLTVGPSADGGSLADFCLTGLETMGEKVWKPL